MNNSNILLLVLLTLALVQADPVTYHTCIQDSVNSDSNITPFVPKNSQLPLCVSGGATTDCLSTEKQNIRIQFDYSNIYNYTESQQISDESFLKIYQAFESIASWIADEIISPNYEIYSTPANVSFTSDSIQDNAANLLQYHNLIIPDQLSNLGYDADLVIFFTIDGTTDDVYFTKSMTLGYDPTTGRPTAAFLAVNAELLQAVRSEELQNPNFQAYQEILYIVLHEVVHILGFQDGLIEKWINIAETISSGTITKYTSPTLNLAILNDGNLEYDVGSDCTISGHTQDIPPLNFGGFTNDFQCNLTGDNVCDSNSIYEDNYSLEDQITYDAGTGLQTNANKVHKLLVTPNLIEYASFYYGATVQGVPLEDEPSFLSHFEKTFFPNELMAPTKESIVSYSKFTVSLLQDSGWYFYNQKVDYIDIFQYFEAQELELYTQSTDLCKVDDTTISYQGNSVLSCKTTCEDNTLNIHTFATFSKLCRDISLNDNNNGVEGTLTSYFSAAFYSSLSNQNYIAQNDEIACYQYECNGSDISIVINQDLSVECLNDNEILEIHDKGFDGYIKCPANIEITCQNLDSYNCYLNCYQNGACVSGNCLCFQGYSGPNCQCYRQYYYTTTKTCGCSSNCQQCKQDNQNECLECYSGYLLELSNLKCYLQASGFAIKIVQDELVYVTCTANCDQCDYELSKQTTICNRCLNGFFLNQNNQCVKTCSSDEKSSYVTDVPECVKYCSGGYVQNYPLYIYSQNSEVSSYDPKNNIDFKTCYSECPTGTYLGDDTCETACLNAYIINGNQCEFYCKQNQFYLENYSNGAYIKECYSQCPEGYFNYLDPINGNLCVVECQLGTYAEQESDESIYCYSGTPTAQVLEKYSYQKDNVQFYLNECLPNTYLDLASKKCYDVCQNNQISIVPLQTCSDECFSDWVTYVIDSNTFCDERCPNDQAYIIDNGVCQPFTQCTTDGDVYLYDYSQCITPATASTCPSPSLTYSSNDRILCYLNNCPINTILLEDGQTCVDIQGVIDLNGVKLLGSDETPQDSNPCSDSSSFIILDDQIECSTECNGWSFIESNIKYCSESCAGDQYEHVVYTPLTNRVVLQQPLGSLYDELPDQEIQIPLETSSEQTCVKQCPDGYIPLITADVNQCIEFSDNETKCEQGFLENQVCYTNGLCPDGSFGYVVDEQWECLSSCPDGTILSYVGYQNKNKGFLQQYCLDYDCPDYEYTLTINDNVSECVLDCRIIGMVNQASNQQNQPGNCQQPNDDCLTNVYTEGCCSEQRLVMLLGNGSYKCGTCVPTAYYKNGLFENNCNNNNGYYSYWFNGCIVCSQQCPSNPDDKYYPDKNGIRVCVSDCSKTDFPFTFIKEEQPGECLAECISPNFIQSVGSNECAPSCLQDPPYYYITQVNNHDIQTCYISCQDVEIPNTTMYITTNYQCAEACPIDQYPILAMNGLLGCGTQCQQSDEYAVSNYSKGYYTCQSNCPIYENYALNGFCESSCRQLEIFQFSYYVQGADYYKCVTSCPDGTYLQYISYDESAECLDQCSSGKLYNFPNQVSGGECINSCPTFTYEYQQADGEYICESQCLPPLNYYQNECVVDCPTGYKSVEMEGDSNNQYCTNQEVQYYKYQLLGSGIYENQKPCSNDAQMYDPRQPSCIDIGSCSNGSDQQLFVDLGVVCLATCPGPNAQIGTNQYYQFNYIGTNSLYSSLQECSQECPSDLPIYNDVSNAFTCIASCSDTTYYINGQQHCNTSCADTLLNDEDNSYCTQQTCSFPQSVYQFNSDHQQECIAFWNCEKTYINKFGTNYVCSNTICLGQDATSIEYAWGEVIQVCS